MEGAERAAAIRKITELPPEQVLKVLIFMAGLEAGEAMGDPGNRNVHQGDRRTELAFVSPGAGGGGTHVKMGRTVPGGPLSKPAARATITGKFQSGPLLRTGDTP